LLGGGGFFVGAGDQRSNHTGAGKNGKRRPDHERRRERKSTAPKTKKEHQVSAGKDMPRGRASSQGRRKKKKHSKAAAFGRKWQSHKGGSERRPAEKKKNGGEVRRTGPEKRLTAGRRKPKTEPRTLPILLLRTEKSEPSYTGAHRSERRKDELGAPSRKGIGRGGV